MKIAIIGAGRIGGNIARQAVRTGHDVTLAFSRNEQRLADLADSIGARAAAPAAAVADADLVVVSVPWSTLPEAIGVMGDLSGRIVVDTTNQFGTGPMPAPGQTAAAFNAARMPGARYVKAFNTLTSGFQEEAAGRTGDERVVQWVCGDDEAAKAAVSELVDSMGYAAVDLGGTAGCAVMEAPRRDGAVYGEEYRRADAIAVVESVRTSRPIPPTPVYG